VYAQAVPTATGTTAAGSVRGRAPSTQMLPGVDAVAGLGDAGGEAPGVDVAVMSGEVSG
jgi:hypothetical protein